MSRISRPSPATVIALVALFVALGGTSYAALSVTGKNVKNGSLTGKDIKKNSLGGTQIAESKLKTVPNARTASSANALSAAAASGFFSSKKVTTSGVVKIPVVGTSLATSPPKFLIQKGPFKIGIACYDAGAGKTTANMVLTSTEPNSILDGQVGTVLDDRKNTSDAFLADTNGLSLQAPSGATLSALLEITLNGPNGACSASADGIAFP